MSDITDYDVDLMMQRVRRETIEECAKLAEQWSKNWGDEAADIATAIRRLLNEDWP